MNEENKISMTRGDTARWKFQRLDANGNPIKAIADYCWFTVKTNDMKKETILQKTIDNMEFGEDYFYRFTIEPEDTNNLQYGDYVYDLEVIQEDYKQTISKGIFTLEYEVTFVNNEVK